MWAQDARSLDAVPGGDGESVRDVVSRLVALVQVCCSFSAVNWLRGRHQMLQDREPGGRGRGGGWTGKEG